MNVKYFGVIKDLVYLKNRYICKLYMKIINN